MKCSPDSKQEHSHESDILEAALRNSCTSKSEQMRFAAGASLSESESLSRCSRLVARSARAWFWVLRRSWWSTTNRPRRNRVLLEGSAGHGCTGSSSSALTALRRDSGSRLFYNFCSAENTVHLAVLYSAIHCKSSHVYILVGRETGLALCLQPGGNLPNRQPQALVPFAQAAPLLH